MKIRKKKQRGLGRKLNNLFNKIDSFELVKIDKVYEEFVVPSNNFLDTSKVSIKIKFMSKWLDVTEKFIKKNPNNEYCKIVGMIDTIYMSNSRIIFFYDEEYYNNFWKRNNSYQKWDVLDSNRSLIKRLNIHTNLKEVGFMETIEDEDYQYITELWFYGDVDEIKL